MATSLVSTGVQFPDSSIQTTAATAGAKGANVQTFTSSGTWTKPSGYNANSRVLIQCWGGGGGGYSSGTPVGTGGGGGGYNERWVTLSTLGSTVTVTVGAGGAAGSPGSAGGTTSFGTTVYAYGGGAGSTGNYTSVPGGGGGGQLSAGNTYFTDNGLTTTAAQGYPGEPGGQNGSNITPLRFEGAGFVGNNPGLNCVAGYFKGGGGGGSFGTTYCCFYQYSGPGAPSVWGGGGGGTGARTGSVVAGGLSKYGGNGGNGGKSANATAGAQPGGGGGGGYSSYLGAAGAAGQVIVTVFDGT